MSAALTWNPSLELHVAAMDETHQEFVELLGQVQAASDANLLLQWQALIAHTEEHFAQEDLWMVATGFGANNCHTMQHATVLSILREGAEQAAHGKLDVIRGMAADLTTWFVHHAKTMDAALAQHMQTLEYDTVTGLMPNRSALPATPITGCGGACSPSTEKSAAPSPV